MILEVYDDCARGTPILSRKSMIMKSKIQIGYDEMYYHKTGTVCVIDGCLFYVYGAGDFVGSVWPSTATGSVSFDDEETFKDYFDHVEDMSLALEDDSDILAKINIRFGTTFTFEYFCKRTVNKKYSITDEEDGVLVESITFVEFATSNVDDQNLCNIVDGLKVGESFISGGGAAPFFEVKRIA
jgi:hypothetical protein